ncbi:flagellar protein FlaG [Paenibacillus taichungensis]|uniref:flagellar protein FlaG n=1 Tax=Paenibacillus taichungensis TaxID=484184 RepID=UPI0039A4E351
MGTIGSTGSSIDNGNKELFAKKGNNVNQESASQIASSQNGVNHHKTNAVEELKKAIEAIQGPQKSLEFSVHKETHSIMIKVTNRETGELIREVPPEKLLDVAARMMELAGLIIDKKI